MAARKAFDGIMEGLRQALDIEAGRAQPHRVHRPDGMVESHYVGIVRRVDGFDFEVTIPDFPGCIGAGVTIDEAVAAAELALAEHVAGDTPLSIADASTREQVMAEHDVRPNMLVDVKLVRPR